MSVAELDLRQALLSRAADLVGRVNALQVVGDHTAATWLCWTQEFLRTGNVDQAQTERDLEYARGVCVGINGVTPLLSCLELRDLYARASARRSAIRCALLAMRSQADAFEAEAHELERMLGGAR